MEICDLINESSDAARDAMKAIKKRLTQYIGKNYQVILYTLTVLETCVKNCGKSFHVLVANKDFIQELVKLIGPKYDPPALVQERVIPFVCLFVCLLTYSRSSIFYLLFICNYNHQINNMKFYTSHIENI